MTKQYSPPPAGVRVRPGDSVGVLAWSNVAFTLRCNISFLRDGETNPTTVNPGDAIVTSNRAASAGALLTFTDPGLIQGVSFAGVGGGGAGPTQRGQTYVQALLTASGSAIGVYQTLSAGYFYGGWIGALGQVVEPGPAGGHGAMIRTATANPAANAEIANQQTPTGSIQRLASVSVQIVQGLTQTPLPTLRIQTSTPTTIVQIPITTTAIGASSTAQLTWAIGLVQSSFTAVVGDEFHTAPLPANLFLIGGDIWNTLTDGIGANTDYGSALFDVEEWVMPN